MTEKIAHQNPIETGKEKVRVILEYNFKCPISFVERNLYRYLCEARKKNIKIPYFNLGIYNGSKKYLSFDIEKNQKDIVERLFGAMKGIELRIVKR